MEETAKLGRVSGMQIGPEQGAFMTMLTQARGRNVRGRSRHVHRVLVAVHRPRARAGRPADLLRRERRVDVHRPAPLGAGRGRRPHRPAHRTGDRDVAIAAEGPDRRPRFIDADKSGYLDYYEELVDAPAPRRRAARRQRAVERSGHRRGGERRRHGCDPRLQRPSWPTDRASTPSCCPSATASPSSAGSSPRPSATSESDAVGHLHRRAVARILQRSDQNISGGRHAEEVRRGTDEFMARLADLSGHAIVALATTLRHEMAVGGR